LVGSFEGFWGISSAAERKFEGFAGSLKVAEFCGVSSLLSTREERKLLHHNPVEAKLVETQRPSKKTQPLSRTRAKNPWTSFVFQFLKIGPSSRVGLAETFQSTHWKNLQPTK
jgi:hypothetical protein